MIKKKLQKQEKLQNGVVLKEIHIVWTAKGLVKKAILDISGWVKDLEQRYHIAFEDLTVPLSDLGFVSTNHRDELYITFEKDDELLCKLDETLSKIEDIAKNAFVLNTPTDSFVIDVRALAKDLGDVKLKAVEIYIDDKIEGVAKIDITPWFERHFPDIDAELIEPTVVLLKFPQIDWWSIGEIYVSFSNPTDLVPIVKKFLDTLKKEIGDVLAKVK